MNQAAAGMNSAADTIRTASKWNLTGCFSAQGVSAPVSKTANSMAGWYSNYCPELNAQIEAANGQINAVSAGVDQLYAGSQKVNAGTTSSFCTFHSGKRNEGIFQKQQRELKH